MEASLIIPFYKDIPGLELILLALNKQSAKGRFDVIIAEDDNANATRDFLSAISPTLSFPIQHTTQDDIGFRKCKALNMAVKIAASDFLVFIDGDCIPHRHLIKEYLQSKEKKKVLYGRRVNLSQSFTETLLKTKNLNKLNFLSLLGTGTTRIKEALYIPFAPEFAKSKRQFWGCNWGILKEDLLAINGFDEDYAEYGYEDIDVYIRLYAAGCRPKSMKFQAIMYHLYHKHRATNEMMNRGEIMFEQKKQSGIYRCKNGIEKL
jgi:cellulose synthase/poly-beta-1,6-N-acetylglucosamine synthase-like glycosyltransferase